jgi:uncharacterized protein YecA (UPF0149 family)
LLVLGKILPAASEAKQVTHHTSTRDLVWRLLQQAQDLLDKKAVLSASSLVQNDLSPSKWLSSVTLNGRKFQVSQAFSTHEIYINPHIHS